MRTPTVEPEPERSIPIMFTQVKNAKTLILVPNVRRLRMHVADEFLQDPSRSVVVAPAVAVFSHWVESTLARMLLLEGQPAPGRIDAIELQRIWARALGEEMNFLSDEARYLAAGQARSARRLIDSWMPGESIWLEQGLRAASASVSARLRSRQVITPEGWLDALAKRLLERANCPFALPEKILLDGFLELTLLEQRLMAALEQKGVAVEHLPAPDQPASQSALDSFPSLGDELAAAAYWAGARLAAGDQRIAVVVNSLEKHAREVRRVFENVLCTDRRLALDDLTDCSFHLGAGETLDAHSVIQDALMLLSLSIGGFGRDLEFPVMSRWLLSPNWSGADTQRSARARLELRLRRDGCYRYPITAVLRMARAMEEDLGPLINCCQQVERVVKGGGDNAHNPELFHAVLEAWGWPGPLARGADLALHVKQFGGLLEQLGGFECDSRVTALSALRQLCASSRVELRGGPLSPIQIISPEDAVNRRFDAAWVANVHDGNWPGPPLANPFLPPGALARIPRCSAAGELAYCERLTVELQALAPEVRFSWCRQSGDIPNGASALLKHLPERDPNLPDAGPAALCERVAPRGEGWAGYRNHPWLRPVVDGQGLKLSAGPGAATADAFPGGSAMLADQAACPMMAYFKHRLQARFEDMPRAFADAAYRGSLMHTALQLLYSNHLGQAGVPPPSAVPEAVAAAMSRHRARRRLPQVSFDAERERLEVLLRQWLEFESGRPGFAVAALEETIDGVLLGHPISVRADRVDRLPDGSLMVIDYKSSQGRISGWSLPRLQNPQLPLYADLISRHRTGDVVRGIIQATVRGGELAFSGIVAEVDAKFDGIKSFDDRRMAFAQRFNDWEALATHWRQGIDALAREVHEGVAENTLYERDSLNWSGLDLLLRREEGESWLMEHGAWSADGEEERNGQAGR